MYIFVTEFAEAMMVNPASTFEFPEMNSWTVALSALARDTAPIELLDPVT